MDTWGPYKTITYNGCKYILTIVDDFSRMTWVSLMVLKSDAIKDFTAYVENQYSTSIKAVRTDNALELCEGELKDFFVVKGIVHQKTCVYTPQQNEVVERKHKHIIETSGALFFKSKLPPPEYWGECILCSVHLINRMPL